MKQNYSLSKAFADKLSKREMLGAVEFDSDCTVAKDWREAGLNQPQGKDGGLRFFAPFDEIFRRDLEAGNTGGQTIAKYPPNLLKSLQPNSIASRCTWLPGLKSNLPITDSTPAPSANWWPGEAGTIQGSNQTFAQNVLQPHLISAQLKISRQLLATASPGADLFLRQEVTRSIFAQLGGAILVGAGSGSNQPLGVLNTMGINSITLASPPTWPEIVACETSAATQNVTDFSDFVYCVTPTQLGIQKTTQRGSGLSKYLTDDSNKTNSYDTLCTTILGSSAKLVSGPFNLCFLGIWASGVELLIDQWTAAENGLVIVTIFLFVDVLIRPSAAAAFTVAS